MAVMEINGMSLSNIYVALFDFSITITFLGDCNIKCERKWNLL